MWCWAIQEAQIKEIKNGRLAMVAFVGFIIAAQVSCILLHISEGADGVAAVLLHDGWGMPCTAGCT